MAFLFTKLPAEITILLFGGLGLCVGRLIVGYADRFRREILSVDVAASLPPHHGNRLLRALPVIGSLLRDGSPHRLSRQHALLVELATGTFFAMYVAAMLLLDCQRVEMVTPSETWRYGRVFYHLILISLLIAATTTDLVDYLIPDEISLVGVIVAVIGAGISGDLQMVHLWFDWNQAGMIVDGQIQYGAYIPQWIQNHHHWHGLAWSVTGLVVGAGIIWLMRLVSSLLLGREAVGFGDVTLMAMVGSFIGWQPVCFVVLLAPLCGIVAGLAVKLLSGRTFIAFGPYLCVSTFLVLCSWQWLWKPVRDIFGHVPSLAMLAAVSLGGLTLLLILLRLYRAIPVESRRKDGTSPPEELS
jgi:leader peptidase (prepilin peptidase)/N-methyltransferase